MDALARSTAVTESRTEARTTRSSDLMAWLKRHLIFVLTVLAPTLLAIMYFGLIASDVYVSESRFLVRSPQQKGQTAMLDQLLSGTNIPGMSRSEDDAYSVRDYILSRDALKELDDKLGVRKSYSSKEVDIFNRFPGLRWDRSFERFYLYYADHVEIDYDPLSSISVLTVRAFTAKDAYDISRQLLDMSERLVNALNDRSHQDLIRFAEDDVRVAADKAHNASLALLAFRSKQSVFDTEQQAEIELEGVAKIQEDFISTEAELAQLTKLSPNNPQIPGLRSRAETLRKAIDSEGAKVTSGKGSLSAHTPAFERLVLESTTADKLLAGAIAELETARSDAARQQLYLERLVEPNLPDKAMEPRRVRSVATVFLLSLMVWGVVSLVIAAVREHAD